MPVPNSFANVTTSIPLSQLDANFNTPITLGNTAIQLGNTVSTLNNMTLANVTVTSGNVTLTNVTVTTANVTTANIATEIVTTSQTLSYGTANGVVYLNGSKVATTGSALTFNGTTLAVTGAFEVTRNTGTLATLTQTSATGYGLTIIPGADTNYQALTINNAANTLNNISMYGDGTAKFAKTIGVGGATPSTSGAGITFPATQSASSDANTLDDYEEGTWTPAIAGGSGTTYANQDGWYTKVGNLVTIGFNLVIGAKGTISGNAQITGLPFTSGSSPARAGGSLAVVNTTGTAYVFTALFVDNGVTTMDIYIKTAAATFTSIPTGTSFFAASTQLIASLSYRV
jgi:hypothetical protein